MAPPKPQKHQKKKKPLQINHRLAAIAAFAFVVIAAGISIQMFGDPRAAGPHRIIALNPGAASAEAAPRVSFSDASAGTPTPMDINAPTMPEGPDGPGADGGVRVQVVGSAPSASLAASPLPHAPLAGMTEPGPNGMLPIVARDGRASSAVYARPFHADGNKPMIAIIIGGLGFNARATTQAIDELPAEVSLSFAPYSQDLQTWIDRARAKGHEVLLELPMEPFDTDADDTGPQTLLSTATAPQNQAHLEQLLSHAVGFFGVTNYQGARFATSSQASAPVAQQLKRRGLVFISTGIGQRTALSVEATRAGLGNTAADRIIDARQEADAIDDQLLNLEALALQNHSAIGAGFAYPVTMQQVGVWAQDISSRGYQLAPASAVLSARAAHR